jgi:hypothetical protein
MEMERSLAAVDNMHKHVDGLRSRANQLRVDAHNRKTHVRSVNFGVGDFVLRGVLARKRERKTSLRWTGPFEVVSCESNYIFIVRDLRTRATQAVHGTRLKFFRNSSFEVTDDVTEYLQFLDGELCIVELFIGIRLKDGRAQLHVIWRGFELEDATWENLDVMNEDLPNAVASYLAALKDNGTVAEKALAAKCS